MTTSNVPFDDNQYTTKSLWTGLVDPSDLDLTKFPVRITLKGLPELIRAIDSTNGNVDPIKVRASDEPPYAVIDGGRRTQATIQLNVIRELRKEARELLVAFISNEKISCSLPEAEFETLGSQVRIAVFGEGCRFIREGSPADGELSSMEYPIELYDVEAALNACGIQVDRNGSPPQIPKCTPLRVLATHYEIEDDEDGFVWAWFSNTSREDLDGDDNHHRDELISYLVLEKEWSQIRTAIRFTLSPSAVSNILRTRTKSTPFLRSLLRHGIVNTSQAKELIELAPDDQDRLAHKFEDNPVSGITEVLEEARQIRWKAAARDLIHEHLEPMKGKQLDCDTHLYLPENTIEELFPNGKHRRYTVRRHDVQAVAKDLGITCEPTNPLIVRAAPSVEQDEVITAPSIARGKSVTLESSSASTHQKTEPMKRPRGRSCTSFVTCLEKCGLWKIDECGDCELHLAGTPSQNEVHRCVFCGGQTKVGYDPGDELSSVHRFTLDTDAFGLHTPEEVEIQHIVHTQCLIDALISSGRMSGEDCRQCQNTSCDVIRTLRHMPERRIAVSSCGGATQTRTIDSEILVKKCNEAYGWRIKAVELSR